MRSGVRRGQPVIGLAVLMIAWVGARAVLMEPADAPAPLAAGLADDAAGAVRPHGDKPAALRAHQLLPGRPGGDGMVGAAAGTAPVNRLAEGPVAARPASAPPGPIAEPTPRVDPIVPPADPRFGNPRLAGGHQLLWLAALAQLPLPPEATPSARGQAPPPATAAQARFSGDAWLLLRRGGSGAGAAGGVPASYGASQAGAVIRYRLAPGSALRPAAYLRVSGAVHRPHDEEAAAGLSFRPVRNLPVAAMAELRVTRLATGTALRPAAMLVGEFPPLPLPAGFTAETYGAAGYVGGRFATAFAEGQLRLERPIARLGPALLRAGGGAWGGAQKGASRLDMGPSATLGFPLGGAGARVSADWRFRLAGSAAPESGPALTISAGF